MSDSDKETLDWTRLWAGTKSERAGAEEPGDLGEIYSHWYWAMRNHWRKLLHDWNRRPPGDCEAVVTPDVAVAGRRGTFRISVTAGESGIECDGRIAIWFPPYCGLRDSFHIKVVQDIAQPPTGWSAAISATTSRDGVGAKVRIHSIGTIGIVVEVLIEDGDLEQGDTVAVVLGDPRARRFMVQEHAQDTVFSIAVDRQGDGDWGRVKRYPAIKVVGDVAHEFRVTGPATPAQGEPFVLTITAADRVNNNPSRHYRGEPQLEAHGDGLVVPESVCFGEEDGGTVRVPGIRCEAAGPSHVLVTDKHLGICGRSNPLCAGFAGSMNIYFGDLHAGTGLEHGSGTADEYFLWARDAEHMDFCGNGDYYNQGADFHIPGEEKWEILSQAIERYNSSGGFVTFPGYETSSLDGHRNVYFRSMDDAVYPGPDQPGRWPNRQTLFDAMRGVDCLIIPHHPKVGVPIDWDYPDEDPLEPFLETYSFQGCAETGGGYSAQAALARGHHFGFVGGSDNHVSQPGHHQRCFGEGGGLAAVFSEDLSREAVFDALKALRCYAVTGAHILLDFRINGHGMRERIVTQDRREICVRAIGAWPIEKVEIIRDNRVAVSRPGEGDEVTLEWEDHEPLENEAFYYARVQQIDGHVAWSSPIRVRG